MRNADAILKLLRSQANPANVDGMARFGISTKGTLGIPVKTLRTLARQIGKNHELALTLWESGIHEARILATIVDEPERVTAGQMNRWARDFDSWDVCDQACQNLFRYTPRAFAQATRWARAQPEFVRRAGFSLMAGLAVKSKEGTDGQFEAFFPLLVAASSDGRNFVKNSVNWALRSIGKRNPHLRSRAIEAAEKCQRRIQVR